MISTHAAFITPIAGRWIDRKGPDAISLLCFIGVIVSAAILAFGALGGAQGLAALTLGMLVLDVAVQCGQTANQARIFALRPDARSRINTAYMTCAFLGGSAGSWIGVKTYALWGWTGVCGAIALAGTIALALFVFASFLLVTVNLERLGAECTEVEGTGLGLTIAKRNIELTGGTIAVTSARGAGTTVRITLPVAPAV